MWNKEFIDTIDTNGPAPESEPARQYYFMKLCKEYYEDRLHKTGHRPSYRVITQGCQMNSKDSEKLGWIMEFIGFIPEDDEEAELNSISADVVIYNTCTVRENANQKVYGHLGILKKQKEKNPDMKIALCGCMMQENDERERIKSAYPYVDIVFGTFNIYRFAELLYTQTVTGHQIIEVWDAPAEMTPELFGRRKYGFKSGVNIMYGCNNFCTYCIVPYVRGRERSRNPGDIIEEIKELTRDGVSEVMLLGQNVNSYKGLDENGDIYSFAKLLREVNEIDGLKRIRFMTSHPKDLSDDLIQAMADCDKVCDHLHLPLQSGSTEILKKMNRHYSREDYLELVDRIRSKNPDISLTTDIIVGFPGETDDDFYDTVDVVKKVGFDSAYTFIYSKRTGTPAAGYDGQIDDDTIKKRFDILLDVIHKASNEIYEKRVGGFYEALIEETNKKSPNMVTGRLSNNSIVHVEGDGSLVGKYIKVELVQNKGFYYIGKIST
ncbi:MAG: tRNA (N6-isopentenyl adenosine(37)-C2)-methylthiotransferase MiaB [Eubacterium sp.]|nr:tRNA (N6-isopentenyl adenosine(37)-C2)-methylthiotransferase MiaB [Eubacterium sp.]